MYVNTLLEQYWEEKVSSKRKEKQSTGTKKLNVSIPHTCYWHIYCFPRHCQNMMLNQLQ